MLWKLLLIITLFSPALAEPPQIACTNTSIKYQDIFRLFHRPYRPEYSRILVNFMHKCSSRPPPRLVHAAHGTNSCRGNLAGYYTGGRNPRITLCYRPRRTQARQILLTVLHETVHSLRVNIDTRRFWRKWLNWELQRVRDSVNTVHPLYRDDKIHEEELLAYSLERYAGYLFDGNRAALRQYTSAEKKLFEFILSGRYS